MTFDSRASKYPVVHEVPAWRGVRHLRLGLAAVVVSGVSAVFGASTLAQASTISPTAFCHKISAATVSSLFGETIPLLGALSPTADNDVCEFAKITSGSVSGVTLNYDYKGTGTASSNAAALKKEKGVSGLVIKSYSSVGGTTYTFTDTFTDTTLHSKIHESGMVSINGSNHYGLVVTKVLPASTLAKLLTLAVKAA